MSPSEDDQHARLIQVANELSAARENFNPMHSAHEGLAVIEEELKELREHVYTNPARRNWRGMRKEAVQLAAMALRFIEDICDPHTIGEVRQFGPLHREMLNIGPAAAKTTGNEWVSPWEATEPALFHEVTPPPPSTDPLICCKPVGTGVCSRRAGHPGECGRYQDCGQQGGTDCILAAGHPGVCRKGPLDTPLGAGREPGDGLLIRPLLVKPDGEN